MNTIQKAYHSIEDYENCYLFSPSVSKRKSVGRQTYYVRRYYNGAKDFENTMARLATNKIKKIVR